MPRGKKKSHKGGHRHFTNEEDLALEAEKVRKEKEWRTKQGLASDDEIEDEEGAGPAKEKEPKEGDDESGSEEESSEEEDDDKPKGVAHLIEIENPNRIKQKSKKVTEIVVDTSKPALSRKEREEFEKQQAKEKYQKMHEAGKTDEARSDLARLALIKKQREDAAKKRDEEKKLAEQTKAAAEQRLLEKKQKSQN